MRLDECKPLLQVQSEAREGTSGAPDLDHQGRVVSVVSGAFDNRPGTFSTPVEKVKELLADQSNAEHWRRENGKWVIVQPSNIRPR